MAEEKKTTINKEVKIVNKCCGGHRGGGTSGAIYGLGLIGVFVYYAQTSNTLMEVLIALGKAIFWPAFLIFRIYGMLGM